MRTYTFYYCINTLFLNKTTQQFALCMLNYMHNKLSNLNNDKHHIQQNDEILSKICQ